MTSVPQPDPGYAERAPRLPEGPIDLRELFSGAGPVEIDVGFGRGHSLFSRAESEPLHQILGIEVKTKWVTKVHERLLEEGRDKLRVFAEDARSLFPRLGPSGSVSAIFVHFPDPWWKKKHHKRTVVTSGFLAEVERLLRAGGLFFYQTDVEPQAAAVLAILEKQPQLDLQHGPAGPFLDQAPFPSRSNRELRVEQDGLPVYRLLARRRGSSSRGR